MTEEEKKVEKLKKKNLRTEIKNLVSSFSGEKNTNLDKFLRDIIPKNKYTYWLMVTDLNGTTVSIPYENFEDYILTLCVLANFEYTVFYSISDYHHRHESKWQHSSQALIIDIDNIDQSALDVATASKEEILNYLIEEYNLTDENMICDYLAVSGHGLHLIYRLPLTPKIYDDIRNDIFSRVNTKFGGDWTAQNPTHFFRLPTSYNLKRKPYIKTRLFQINTKSEISYERFDCFTATEDEIKQSRKQFYDEIAEKRRQTRLKNMALKNGSSACENKPQPKKQNAQHKPKDYKNAKSNTHSKPFNTSNNAYQVELIQTYYPGDFIANTITDLNNLFYFRGGMEGMRHSFAMILCNYLRNEKTQDECFEYMEKYFTSDFYDELKIIIGDSYNKKHYKYSYSKIRQLLNITEEENDRLIGNYSELSQKNAKERKYNKTNNRRKKERHFLKFQYEYYLLSIIKERLENNSVTEVQKQMLTEYGISRTVFYRLKKKLENFSPLEDDKDLLREIYKYKGRLDYADLVQKYEKYFEGENQ